MVGLNFQKILQKWLTFAGRIVVFKTSILLKLSLFERQ